MTAEQREAVRIAVADAQAGTSSSATPPRRLQRLDPFDALRMEHLRQRHTMRRSWSTFLMWVLGVQMSVVDVVFVIYAWAGVKWNIPPVAISAWLGALIVQVVGIATIVVKGIFPEESADFSASHSPEGDS